MAAPAPPSSLSALPAELRTPPLPPVALVGHPEVHRDIGVWASQVLRPPLVALSVADATEQSLVRALGESQHADIWPGYMYSGCNGTADVTLAPSLVPVMDTVIC